MEKCVKCTSICQAKMLKAENRYLKNTLRDLIDYIDQLENLNQELVKKNLDFDFGEN